MITSTNTTPVLADGHYIVFITKDLTHFSRTIKVTSATSTDSILTALKFCKLSHYITGVTKVLV